MQQTALNKDRCILNSIYIYVNIMKQFHDVPCVTPCFFQYPNFALTYQQPDFNYNFVYDQERTLILIF